MTSMPPIETPCLLSRQSAFPVFDVQVIVTDFVEPLHLKATTRLLAIVLGQECRLKAFLWNAGLSFAFLQSL